jgi:hypothetical protein
MPLPELFELVKTGGGICAILLLLAVMWMSKQLEKANIERKEALDKLETSNEKLLNLTERTITLITELKILFGSR